jgi:uncharacterized protein YbjT (DUF2867 family)
LRSEPVLVTGATGYVGGRLVPLLLVDGHRVRVVGRSVSRLKCRPWANAPNLEFAEADMLDSDALARAAKGCWAAYYLVHSMNSRHKDFSAADRQAAHNMAMAAAEGGIERIIYLGGLTGAEARLSKHLRSRHEVGEILKACPVPTTLFRAAMILGAGSASFEIIRYLVDRLPVMVTPGWASTPCQPIAIRNVLFYLKGCLENDETTGGTFDIGGPDVVTYRRLLEIYAEEARLPRRWIIPVPFLTARLSAYWIHVVTPVPAAIGRPLIEGLRNPAVCTENRIRQLIPQELIPCREAMRAALEKVAQQGVETCWSDAGMPPVPEWIQCGDAPYAGGAVLECGYRIVLGARPEAVWAPIKRLGGKTGWYFGNPLWQLRGALDRVAGGIGLRRGRRHPTALYPGDALDFWRVLEIEEPHRLRLLAEMKVPGEALLDFKIHPLDGGRTELQQLSRFLPRGLLGLLYWYGLYPLHQWVFRGMLKAIAKASGGTIHEGPDRFAPRLAHICYIRP